MTLGARARVSLEAPAEVVAQALGAPHPEVRLEVSAAQAPPAPEPKAKKPNRREVMNLLVTESNKTVVLGHLHPRRLRKDYEA